MSEYINTITIEPQDSAEALAQAMATALGSALGWTTDGLSVWQSDNGLRFLFTVSSGNVGLVATNAFITSFAAITNTVSYASGASYCINYLKTDDIVVAGISKTGNSILLASVIAKNANGTWKAIRLHGAATNSYVMVYYADNTYTEAKQWPQDSVTHADASTSLVRYPDPFGGCMFNNLYMIMSCPSFLSDKVLFIGGKYFRFIGIGYAGFAVKVS